MLRWIWHLFQPVASMMRIETDRIDLFFVSHAKSIPASRQYDEDWNTSLAGIPKRGILFQPVASMMRIETYCYFAWWFIFNIPASRQYDEDWNTTHLTLLIGMKWIPASRQYDEDWNEVKCTLHNGKSIPASRQYDEDWNERRVVLRVWHLYSSQSPVWWGLKL